MLLDVKGTNLSFIHATVWSAARREIGISYLLSYDSYLVLRNFFCYASESNKPNTSELQFSDTKILMFVISGNRWQNIVKEGARGYKEKMYRYLLVSENMCVTHLLQKQLLYSLRLFSTNGNFFILAFLFFCFCANNEF